MRYLILSLIGVVAALSIIDSQAASLTQLLLVSAPKALILSM